MSEFQRDATESASLVDEAIKHLEDNEMPLMAAAVRALRSESGKQDAEDAARYRWLRSKTNCKYGTTFEFPRIGTIPGPYEPNTYAARFDACIDMAKEAEDYRDWQHEQGGIGVARDGTDV
jgi:hypothetical protein